MERYQANFREHQAHAEPYTGPTKTEAPKPATDTRSNAKYVGSKNSAVYHLPGCRDIERIKPDNRVEYDAPPAGKRLHQGCPRWHSAQNCWCRTMRIGAPSTVVQFA